jgi:ribosomal-protein-alanine N-acetyltransferase
MRVTMIEIITKRLLIRDHIEEDLNSMHEILSNKKIMFYLPEIKTKNINESRNSLYIAINEANSNNRTKYFFAIIDKVTQDYIGEIGLTKTIESNVMNLGYFIKETYWGKGIVTEASREVISYAFSNLDALKIETGCIVDNKASERVMNKLGMIKNVELKRHVLLHKKLYDRVEYKLMKEEWLKLVAGN